jgi:hypothetical protein
MQRARHRIPGWLGLAGAVGALILVPTLSGCPGTLDPDVAKMAASGSGNGGSSASGGSNGSDGAATGGATGTGGTGASSCTGGNDGASVVTMNCATQYCHDTSGASACGGLDLTIDSGIAARLVGVMSSGSATTNGSICAGTGADAYLIPNSSPAMGLLIEKVGTTPPCGARMPYYPLNGKYLTDSQIQCLQLWATTLTSP